MSRIETELRKWDFLCICAGFKQTCIYRAHLSIIWGIQGLEVHFQYLIWRISFEIQGDRCYPVSAHFFHPKRYLHLVLPKLPQLKPFSWLNLPKEKLPVHLPTLQKLWYRWLMSISLFYFPENLVGHKWHYFRGRKDLLLCRKEELPLIPGGQRQCSILNKLSSNF